MSIYLSTKRQNTWKEKKKIRAIYIYSWELQHFTLTN